MGDQKIIGCKLQELICYCPFHFYLSFHACINNDHTSVTLHYAYFYMWVMLVNKIHSFRLQSFKQIHLPIFCWSNTSMWRMGIQHMREWTCLVISYVEHTKWNMAIYPFWMLHKLSYQTLYTNKIPLKWELIL